MKIRNARCDGIAYLPSDQGAARSERYHPAALVIPPHCVEGAAPRALRNGPLLSVFVLGRLLSPRLIVTSE